MHWQAEGLRRCGQAESLPRWLQNWVKANFASHTARSVLFSHCTAAVLWNCPQRVLKPPPSAGQHAGCQCRPVQASAGQCRPVQAQCRPSAGPVQAQCTSLAKTLVFYFWCCAVQYHAPTVLSCKPLAVFYSCHADVRPPLGAWGRNKHQLPKVKGHFKVHHMHDCLGCGQRIAHAIRAQVPTSRID